MKIFLATDVLIDATIGADQYPHSFKLLNALIDDPDLSLWISAISLVKMDAIGSSAGTKQKVQDLFNLIRENFSIIPFRKSTFLRAAQLDGGDFEYRVQMASAKEFQVDVIVSRHPENFGNNGIPAWTPTQFLKKWDGGELDHIFNVPFLDLKAQHHQIYNEIDDRVTDIIANTGFILGKYVDEFERHFAKLQGARYCLGLSSGTAALHVALLALGIGPGDGVIVPVNTFIATAEAVSMTGAMPVFVDCDEFYNLDVSRLEDTLRQKIRGNHRVKAVVPVHLYGQPAEMARITQLATEYGLMIVEDCCQAHLARYGEKLVGNFGEFGAFSFYPGKNLGAYGEAG